MGGLGKHISQRDREYFEIHGEWYPGQNDVNKAQSAKPKNRDKIKCPWCGRKVELSDKGRIKPHIQSTKVRCSGSWQDYYSHLKRIKDHDK